MAQMFETKDVPVVVSLAASKSAKMPLRGLVIPHRVKWLDRLIPCVAAELGKPLI